MLLLKLQLVAIAKLLYIIMRYFYQKNHILIANNFLILMMSYGQWTNVFVTPDFTLYISYQTTFFKQKNCEVISKRILIIFAPEEAEIFKDYLFILA
jgi:hypothetical protein